MRTLPTVLCLAGLGLAGAGLALVEVRLSGLEHGTRSRAAEEGLLRSEVARLRGEFERAAGGARIDLAEASLDAIRRELDLRGAQLEQVASLQDELVRLSLDQRLADLDREVDERWGELRGVVDAAVELADAGRARVDALAQELDTRHASRELWRELLAPVVQLTGPVSVGSGVLLESRPRGEGHVTYLLTAWHVVRDIQDDPREPITPVPVRIYLEGGVVRDELATVLRHDAELDACLLELASDEPVPHGARLAPRERLAAVRPFDPVWAVGCPLGTDPLPTEGQISSANHVVDGSRYWMINAPTYIGNSGGGIFDADTHELIGIFSKIYNHGSRNPTIVPHMGLVTPLDLVYDWLEGAGYAAVTAGADPDSGEVAGEVAAAAAPRVR